VGIVKELYKDEEIIQVEFEWREFDMILGNLENVV